MCAAADTGKHADRCIILVKPNLAIQAAPTRAEEGPCCHCRYPTATRQSHRRSNTFERYRI
jgi:hypothetical protein